MTDPNYIECEGCRREVECLLDHAPGCPKLSPPAPASSVVEQLTAELDEASERLAFRQQVIETLFATLMVFEMPAQKVERIASNLCMELACDFSLLRQQPHVAALVRIWQHKLAQIEDELLERRRQERKDSPAPELVDCDVCLGTSIMPGTFTTPCSRCTGTGKVAT